MEGYEGGKAQGMDFKTWVMEVEYSV